MSKERTGSEEGQSDALETRPSFADTPHTAVEKTQGRPGLVEGLEYTKRCEVESIDLRRLTRTSHTT